MVNRTKYKYRLIPKYAETAEGWIRRLHKRRHTIYDGVELTRAAARYHISPDTLRKMLRVGGWTPGTSVNNVSKLWTPPAVRR